MSALDAQDVVVIILALDLLSRHTDNELADARRRSNGVKEMAMLAMRQRIAAVRTKLVAMVPS